MNDQNPVENQRSLASLKSSAVRMSHLTDQLLAYAEGGKYQPQLFSVNDLVKDRVTAETMLFDSQIQIITELDRDVHLSSGDVTQIRMVVDVILANALEALPQGGLIRITTGRKRLSETTAKPEDPAKPGSYTFISIEDDGIGMDRETRERIFEPFFTTKIYGRGLGMAAVFGIVRNHDGLITVDSEPDQGTKVVIYLPGIESRQHD